MTAMDDIYRHIDDHVDESIEWLFELVRQPSISAQRVGFDKAPALVAEILGRAGMEAEIVPVPNGGLPSVYGSLGPTDDGPVLLFYQHYDVQPVDPPGTLGHRPIHADQERRPPLRARDV